MPRLIAILLTLFPVLFASGEAVAAIKFGRGITTSLVGTSLRDVSRPQGKIFIQHSQPSMTNVAKQRPYIFDRNELVIRHLQQRRRIVDSSHLAITSQMPIFAKTLRS